MRSRVDRGTSRWIALLVLGILAGGCAESQRPDATGKGTVRGIHAVVTAPELLFMIEESVHGSVNYRGVSGFRSWDDLDYTFNFDILLPGEREPRRIASQYVDVLADTEHTQVLTGTLDNPSIVMWESPERDFTGTESVFDSDFAHMAPQIGQVDVYYLVDGTDPAVGLEVATLSFGERVPHVEFQPGDYVLTLTAPGDPATVLFQSSPVARVAADRSTILLADPSPAITSPVGVGMVTQGGAVQRLADVNSPPLIRVLHAGFGTENFDGYLDENLATVVFPDVGFKELSAYVDAPETVMPLTITPVGDPGTTLYNVDVQQVVGSLRTIAILGEAGSLVARPLNDDARPLSTFPVVRISHLSNNFADGIDIYEVDPGTELTNEVIPRFPFQIVGGSTGFYPAGTGMREFVLTSFGEKTPIGDSIVLDLANGDIVDIAIIDTADPAVAELLIFDSNIP